MITLSSANPRISFENSFFWNNELTVIYERSVIYFAPCGKTKESNLNRPAVADSKDGLFNYQRRGVFSREFPQNKRYMPCQQHLVGIYRWKILCFSSVDVVSE